MKQRADSARFPCPCCGYLTFEGPPGTLDICPVCFWVDNPAALRYATAEIEGVSLLEAQKTYVRIGACEERWLKHVSRPRPLFKKDASWRPLNLALDTIDTETEESAENWPDDMERLYYWRDTYWMRHGRG